MALLRRRWSVAALAVLVVAALATGAAWWWRRSYGYVGGTATATLTFRGCLNSTSWTDPATGVTWEVPDRTVVPDNLGTEWRQPADAPNATYVDALGVVSGTVRFDTRELATFTGSGGGMMPLFRSEPERPVILCEAPPRPRSASAPAPNRPGFDSPLRVAVVTDERSDDGSQPLIPATIQVHEGDALILAVVAPDGVAGLLLPNTMLTVSALAPGRVCPPVTVTVSVDRSAGGARPSFVRLTCPTG